MEITLKKEELPSVLCMLDKLFDMPIGSLLGRVNQSLNLPKNLELFPEQITINLENGAGNNFRPVIAFNDFPKIPFFSKDGDIWIPTI